MALLRRIALLRKENAELRERAEKGGRSPRLLTRRSSSTFTAINNLITGTFRSRSASLTSPEVPPGDTYAKEGMAEDNPVVDSANDASAQEEEDMLPDFPPEEYLADAYQLLRDRYLHVKEELRKSQLSVEAMKKIVEAHASIASEPSQPRNSSDEVLARGTMSELQEEKLQEEEEEGVGTELHLFQLNNETGELHQSPHLDIRTL